MLQVRSDLWISEAAFERLDQDHYIAKIKVQTPDDSRVDWFALPPFYIPHKDGGRSAAVALRDYYQEEIA